jgi:ethanolamine permease
VLTTTLPLFGVELPLAGVILTIFGVAIVYYFLVGSKKLRPMSEEFVLIEDVTSGETGTDEKIG